ncbi:putative DNA helicase [Fictibacillus macauensis ZFHKF-1]|uniref:Putative DNA helicase n=1 Tax=Fictibacillus macauensis ZFHKF-1 TaxID=1196324 RepID=I8AK93_9BACL|nr:DEAD/DEAH box helicase [Fictibacillus macauensis]EIT85959.1 putative DNA helicase [Fictibacillus macauensis ZFHKF-1]
MDEQSVLNAWYLVEALAPCKVPKKSGELNESLFQDHKKRTKVKRISLVEQAESEPWGNYPLKNQQRKKIQHRYYFSCFQNDKLVRYLRRYFQNHNELYNKNFDYLYSFTLLIDDDGKYVKESLFVPMLMDVLRKISAQEKIDFSGLNDSFNSKRQLFEESAQDIFINGVDHKKLLTLVDLFHKEFFKFPNAKDVNYLEIEVIGINEETSLRNFNSFYTEDLERILEKGPNEVLQQYLVGASHHVSIDENRSYIEDILQPKYLPNGRWPSPVEHRLSLMQQVAVNQTLSSQEPISSVNGPPGTGKTTLLKDIFADIVVRRAEQMVKLNHPTEAFIKTDEVKNNANCYELSLSLSQFSMVVTSSNNGAVENISKDLPKLSEVIREGKKSKFPQYEEHYAKEAKNLAMYPASAKLLLDTEANAWGIFSGALGKSSNISKYNKVLRESLLKELEAEHQQLTLQDWKNIVKEFQHTFNTVNHLKNNLQEYCNQTSLVSSLEVEQQLLKRTDHEIESLHEDIQWLEKQISLVPKLTLLQKLMMKKDRQRVEFQKELLSLITTLKEKKKEQARQRNVVNTIQVQLLNRKEQERYYKEQGLITPDDAYWSKDRTTYEYRQQHTIWLTDELNFQRGLLFLKAMKVHKYLLAFNLIPIKATINQLAGKKNIVDSPKILHHMWKTIHLITPVISTTFASFSSMYKGIEKNHIDYLFIDEAGQATPQQAAGALWRSKRAIVVGDPIQIEPVVPVDEVLLDELKNHFQLSSRQIGMTASVQTLADQANPFGMYKNDLWIGSPLWVHRRCLDPMFTIANKIAYDEKMVLAQKKTGESVWYDCSGRAIKEQFVMEQGTFITTIVNKAWTNQVKPNLFIITPFTAIKVELKKMIKQALYLSQQASVTKKEISDWVEESVGTVHTFQGKEADIVYLVVGTDDRTDPAANWSCATPNLINVAVTRAKKEFYVVGDLKRFSKKQYYSNVLQEVLVETTKNPVHT